MKTKFIKNIDLNKNGIAEEVTLLKTVEVGKDSEGVPQRELWFIKNNELDDIDRQRLLDVLKKSAKLGDAQPLYETMADVTLGNGMNALDYFHQYVKVLYPSGAIQKPRAGHRSVSASTTFV